MTHVETIRAYIKARKKHSRDCACADCEDHNAVLAALKQIERDAARLNWLDEQSTPMESMGKPIEYHTGMTWTERETFRSAIDATMRSQEESRKD